MTRTIEELRQSILDKADTDEAFRARLLQGPKEVIAKEFDVNFPEGFNMHVHEDSMETAHLVLPPPSRLTSEQMASISGGGHGGTYP